MPKSTGSITINAPIERVFNAAADPKIIAQISSGALVGTKGENGELGSYADWEYLKLRSRTTVSEVNKPHKLVQEMTGAMPGRWIWNLEQDGQVVKADFCIEYSVPGGVLGKMANKLFLGRMNQKNLEKTMYGLKAYCEK
jgi:carbon monoxide dehydrogenase subunit G